jgi:nucleoside-diphosphate-sugar epimerase
MTRELVLVDGAAGFLGRHVVQAVREAGHAVRATDRPGTDLPRLDGVENVHCDLARDGLGRLFAGVKKAVHVAGLFDLGASRKALHAANVEVAERVARAALEHHVTRYIHVSSVTVYGRPSVAPCPENAPRRPWSLYEQTKAEGEKRVEKLAKKGLPMVIVRPSGIYGPHSRNGLAIMLAQYSMAKATGRTEGLKAFRIASRMTHVHVEDVAHAIAHLLDAPGVEGRIFNVADTTPLSWGELTEAVEKMFGLDLGPEVPLSPVRVRMMRNLFRYVSPVRDKINGKLLQRWKELSQKESLVPALEPKIEAHAYDYWLADHVYDTHALRQSGYVFRHPDPVVGLKETLDWYVKERWLPPVTGRA